MILCLHRTSVKKKKKYVDIIITNFLKDIYLIKY